MLRRPTRRCYLHAPRVELRSSSAQTRPACVDVIACGPASDTSGDAVEADLRTLQNTVTGSARRRKSSVRRARRCSATQAARADAAPLAARALRGDRGAQPCVVERPTPRGAGGGRRRRQPPERRKAPLQRFGRLSRRRRPCVRGRTSSTGATTTRGLSAPTQSREMTSACGRTLGKQVWFPPARRSPQQRHVCEQISCANSTSPRWHRPEGSVITLPFSEPSTPRPRPGRPAVGVVVSGAATDAVPAPRLSVGRNARITATQGLESLRVRRGSARGAHGKSCADAARRSLCVTCVRLGGSDEGRLLFVHRTASTLRCSSSTSRRPAASTERRSGACLIAAASRPLHRRLAFHARGDAGASRVLQARDASGEEAASPTTSSRATA